MSEVKTRTGTWSNTRPKMAIKSPVTTTQPALRHGARRQEFEAAEWSWIRPSVICLLRQVVYEMFPADHEHVESPVRPCMISWWHNCVLARTCNFFHRLLSIFQFNFWRRTFAIGFYEKNLSDLILWFCVQFSFNLISTSRGGHNVTTPPPPRTLTQISQERLEVLT